MNWTTLLAPIKATERYKSLWQQVEEAYDRQICYPTKENLFRALELTPFDAIKVVILGQDPYHGPFQANGLAFSVANELNAPPSLKNILKELENDLGIVKNTHDLTDWATQGVLLLNTTLSVQAHLPNSHKNFGWEYLTDHIIQQISEKHQNVVFVLWGGEAKKKKHLINEQKHLIISSPHPSPLSSYRGFFGSKPFSKINAYLMEKKLEKIRW